MPIWEQQHEYGNTFMVTGHAPGRVELLGNHTDYNDGFVLSFATNYGIDYKAQVHSRPEIEVRTDNLRTSEIFSIDQPIVPNPQASWANYPKGVLVELQKRKIPFGPFWVQVHSNLPAGAGMSSSAAFEVATLLAVKKLFPFEASRIELARIAQAAENNFVGVKCGLLDQISSLFGKKDHAIFIDCRTYEVQNVPLHPGFVFVVAHSGVKHALVGGEYNQRREQCEKGAAFFGVKALRDVSVAELEKRRAELVAYDPVAARRSEHVICENQRVLDGVADLKAGNMQAFGQKMFASHESSRVLFENSIPELDAMVQIAKGLPGCIGSRLTGGGFGGATINMVERNAAEQFQKALAEAYHAKTGHTCTFNICKAADGAI